jgi:hypothetical protein
MALRRASGSALSAAFWVEVHAVSSAGGAVSALSAWGLLGSAVSVTPSSSRLRLARSLGDRCHSTHLPPGCVSGGSLVSRTFRMPSHPSNEGCLRISDERSCSRRSGRSEASSAGPPCALGAAARVPLGVAALGALAAAGRWRAPGFGLSRGVGGKHLTSRRGFVPPPRLPGYALLSGRCRDAAKAGSVVLSARFTSNDRRSAAGIGRSKNRRPPRSCGSLAVRILQRPRRAPPSSSPRGRRRPAGTRPAMLDKVSGHMLRCMSAVGARRVHCEAAGGGVWARMGTGTPQSIRLSRKPAQVGFLIGAPGFEPGTSSPPD